MNRELKALKCVLMLRKFNKYQSKEKQLAEALAYNDSQLNEWLESLKNPQMAEPEEENSILDTEDLYALCTTHDYSPSNPWDAPGMSIRDFI